MNQPFTTTGNGQRSYVRTHIVSFEDTNVMGNVYYVCHVAWQGRCREMFLRDHAPEILQEIERDLRLVTGRVSCEYFYELHVFETVEIRMRLAHLRQNRIGLAFDYVVCRAGDEVLAARGFQEIICMTKTGGGLIPGQIPAGLAGALQQYGSEFQEAPTAG